MVLSEHNTLNKVDLQLWNKKKTLKSKIQTYFWSTDDYCVSYDCNIAIDMNTKVSGSKKQIYKLNNFAVFHKKKKLLSWPFTSGNIFCNISKMLQRNQAFSTTLLLRSLSILPLLRHNTQTNLHFYKVSIIKCDIRLTQKGRKMANEIVHWDTRWESNT